MRRLQQKARSRGYDPETSKILKLAYVVNALRTGRPKVATEEKSAEIVSLSKLLYCLKGHTNNK